MQPLNDTSFVDGVEASRSPELSRAHARLLEMLLRTRGIGISPGTGGERASYRVGFGDADWHFLRVYADGRVDACLQEFRHRGRDDVADAMTDALGPLLSPEKRGLGYPALVARVPELPVHELAAAVRATLDAWRGARVQ